MAGVQGDGYTKSMMTVDHTHHKIHDGNHFFVRQVVDQAINTVFDLQITTPDTTNWSHMLWWVSAEAEIDLYIYEDAVIVNPGTTLVAINSNRNSSRTSGMTLASQVNGSIADANTDTTVAAATLLEQLKAGAGPNRSGGANRDHEIVLRQGTVYCFRVFFTKASYLSYDLHWYKHTNTQPLPG